MDVSFSPPITPRWQRFALISLLVAGGLLVLGVWAPWPHLKHTQPLMPAALSSGQGSVVPHVVGGQEWSSGTRTLLLSDGHRAAPAGLLAHLYTDSSAGDKKTLDKQGALFGRVLEVGLDATGHPRIIFAGGLPGDPEVTCSFRADFAKAISRLQAGQMVVVRGIVRGKKERVEVTDCELLGQERP